MSSITVYYNVGSDATKGSHLQSKIGKMAKRRGMSASDYNWHSLLSYCNFTGEVTDRILYNFAKKVKSVDNVTKVKTESEKLY